jgi:hypothetical protein
MKNGKFDQFFVKNHKLSKRNIRVSYCDFFASTGAKFFLNACFIDENAQKLTIFGKKRHNFWNEKWPILVNKIISQSMSYWKTFDKNKQVQEELPQYVVLLLFVVLY